MTKLEFMPPIASTGITTIVVSLCCAAVVIYTGSTGIITTTVTSHHAKLSQSAEPAGGREATPRGCAAQGAGIFIVPTP